MTGGGTIRLNAMSGNREVWETETNEWRTFKDSDESGLFWIIQEESGVYAPQITRDALNIFFEQNRFDPLLDALNSLEWDGQERIGGFLHFAMGADDTAYVRECSRLIFSGGVHRAFEPGCKFDDMVVLVGSQGGGKSSVIRWLNMIDDFFTEVKTIEGAQSIEALTGHWVCEMSELMAMTNVKAIEAVKAFITRQEDNYRVPYARYSTTIPRRSIFIGTTNNDRFLNDKTGNRRFYPVTTHSDGYDVGEREEEIREYIRQCWAEAVSKYRSGNMPAYAKREYISDIREAQEAALEDDWRVGPIREFLAKKAASDDPFTCIKELWDELNKNYDIQRPPERSDSIDIAKIVSMERGWVKAGQHRFDKHGSQKSYKYIGTVVSGAENSDCPF